MLPITRNILFVGAHPDDIEINAGGTISSLIANNCNPFIAIMTGSQVRQGEALNGILKLGLDIHLSRNVHLYDFEDTRLHLCKSEMIATIDKIIKKYDIDTLVTHYPYDTHNDHVAVSEACLASARLVPNLIFFKPTYPSGRPIIPFNPNLVIELTPEDIKNKKAALAEHISQISKYGEQEWLRVQEGISEADAWVYGGFHGYAELFQISRIKL